MKRPVKILLIVAAVLAVLLVAVDRVGNYVAEHVAANTIQSSQDLPSRPDVDIGGFPFLTQVVARDFDQITVTAHDVPVNRDDDILDLSDLLVTLHHVTAPGNLSSVHADTATAVATIDYAELSKRLHLDVTYAGDGRVKASKSVTIAGQTLSAQVTAAPRLVDGVLSFTKTAVNGLGSLAQHLPDAIQRLFTERFSLQGLPFNLRVDSLDVDSSGVRIALSGSNLTYRR